MEYILVALITTLVFFADVNHQQIEELQVKVEELELKTEELDEHIFILQGDDYNETY